ncbi:hypothetical protein brsh051_08760 [Brooklawnia propionicigenes]|uniref:Uncharacterized protein n=1 Tax=Brooklawnia propionicigenes TaxID=3041175 RepID=A0AAN0KAW3_9ACTN|nr:hypothetical protein brsh051_08760 [Brooklawnia sp. SH051]
MHLLVAGADPLAAAFDQLTIDLRRQDASAHPVPGLCHEDLLATRDKVVRCGQPSETGSDHYAIQHSHQSTDRPSAARRWVPGAIPPSDGAEDLVDAHSCLQPAVQCVAELPGPEHRGCGQQ